MSKPEWTKIGTVEVCVGTDGVAAVSFDGVVAFCVSRKSGLGWDSKTAFEERHCQPPEPRHIIRDYADGSCVVESTEKDEQGRPLRVAFVRAASSEPAWLSSWKRVGMFQDTEQDAIDRAIRYVETGGGDGGRS